jgi:hypothetical protein
MKKLTKTRMLLLSFCLIGGLLPAQKEEVNGAKKVSWVAQATLFSLECGQNDPFRLGVGLEGDYYFQRFLSLHALVNKSYFGVAKFDAKALNTDANTLNTFVFMELGCRLNLLDRAGASTLKWFEVVSRSGNTVYGYDRQATYAARKIFGVRAGLYVNREIVSSDMNGGNSPTKNLAQLKTDDGLIYGGNLPVFTNMHVMGAYGGLSFVSLINTSEKQRLRETFIDVLYAPSVSFENISQGGKSSHITPNAPGSFRTSTLGWRIGAVVSVPKFPGYATGFELGMRPGIKSHGLYFGCRMSIVFSK